MESQDRAQRLEVNVIVASEFEFRHRTWVIPLRPGDSLSIRVTVLETERSRSKPDRGTVRSLVEVMNQNENRHEPKTLEYREIVGRESGADKTSPSPV